MSPESESMVHIARGLRRVREAQCLSQEALAEQAGVSRVTISRIENGRDVSTTTLAKVAASLGLSLRVEEDLAGPRD
ncbi:helix-turn-helix transcriptional regulator [Brevibacterium litoralis]|uniref:helix-turn-helix transcriptional regulator n=1 Tax=Brevibacterium litoralis TaxID=3138935 RepID=UPI0032EE5353